jgi:ABC-type polar amino acid transport system ATPase subunit
VSAEALHQDVELAIRGVHTDYGGGAVLRGVSLQILRGETLVIVGPSGVGKSTLLRCLNLTHPISQGEIVFRGQTIASTRGAEVDDDRLRRQIGMVFQGFNLWPNKTVLENLIEAPVHVLKLRREDAVPLARDWLDKTDVAEFEARYPSELSGGQQQRVALARALIMDPQVLLLDEITSALDVESTARLLRLLESLRDPKRTFVVVSHHLQFARRAADRIALMLDGRIAELGSPTAVLDHPQQDESRRFFSLIAEL